MTRQKLLNIYLNDHLAGSVVGQELTKRCLANNPGTELGTFLTSFLHEVNEDRSTLEEVIDAVGGQPDRLKARAGWLSEKVGRLKLNGQWRGYSDLSRLVEIEGLCIGVEGKRSLWAALKAVSENDSRLQSYDFAALESRARRQRDDLEVHRKAAAEIAFSGRDIPAGR
ncbi:MAG TPA: hypothetical protein VHV50_05270 [Actinomycetota bacterium]|nr:hypothetical protein [Actinomycetota bacterium]